MVDARGTGMPLIIHWGADLGDLDQTALTTLADSTVPAVPPSSIDRPLRPSILPVRAEGWTGRPGIEGSRAAGMAAPVFTLVSAEQDGLTRLLLAAVDDRLGLRLELRLGITESGLVQIGQTLSNTGEEPWSLAALATTLPIPPRAVEVLDFGGRWAGERQPQRRRVEQGSWERRIRHGRPGHDSAFLFAAGTPGFGFENGDVWALHLAWSGDQDLSSEFSATGHRTLVAGELLAPGEVVLRPGERYDTPEVFGAWSAEGLDGVSRRFHQEVRTWGQSDPLPKVVLNTWEAVYFDQDIDRLLFLAERAAAIGVERFVLDDGWMQGRTDDRRALGDWLVDPVRWPQGLHPLTDRVGELGMEFGLWIEPEMVSLDSDLARAHPEWLLTDEGGATPIAWRHQHALDLANPDAFDHVLRQLISLLEEYPITFLKWDQNRDLLGGSVRAQTLATRRLMTTLREEHPDVIIESCSSGGGRIELGVLRQAGRVWASDTNDPVDRQAIQRWTSLIVPPELMGSHVGAPKAHTTGRHASLELRLATASLASAGIEWDLSAADASDLERMRAWISWYVTIRPLIATGMTVRLDQAEPGILTTGIVAHDRSSAVFHSVCTETVRAAVPAPFRFAQLDEAASYDVAIVPFASTPTFVADAPPPWMGAPVVLSGRVLTQIGLPLPPMNIGEVLTVQLTRLE